MFKKEGLSVLSIIAILVLVFFVGCEKAAEKTIQNATGGKAKIDTNKGTVSIKTNQGSMEVGGTQTWPSKMPSDVPKLTYGRITGVSETNTPKGLSIFVAIGGISPAEFDKYQGMLEGAGWKIASVTKADDGLFMHAKKQSSALTVSFSGKGGKDFSGGVAYTEGK